MPVTMWQEAFSQRDGARVAANAGRQARPENYSDAGRMEDLPFEHPKSVGGWSYLEAMVRHLYVIDTGRRIAYSTMGSLAEVKAP